MTDVQFDPAEHPHRRYNRLKDEWILVSPHRAKRPWLGEQSKESEAASVSHDPECYLCAGNRRANGAVNPDYCGPFVFENDFAALLPDTPVQVQEGDAMFRLAPARGTSRVICFSPDHSRGLSALDLAEIAAVVDCWCAQSEELGQAYAHVQLFENRGAMMGCSNPHPHGQLWATAHIPAEIDREDRSQRQWMDARGSPLLLDLVEREAGGPRVVTKNVHWLAIVPYWAAWPFETLLLPRFPVQRLPELGAVERRDLAIILKDLTTRYDKLFGCEFPYSMGWHGAPYIDDDLGHWQLHAHFYPPLLRSSAVRKFMVGYEMLAETQRDLTPEHAAERLRAVDGMR